MIVNDKQELVAQAKLESFEKSYNGLLHSNDAFEVMEREALASSIDELKDELDIYRKAKSGAVDIKSVLSISELRVQLVLIRISSGMSTGKFAELAGISTEKATKLEATSYADAGLSLLLRLSELLGVRVDKVLDDEGQEIFDINAKFDFSSLDFGSSLQELVNRGWVSSENKIEDVSELILKSGAETNLSLHKKSSFGERSPKQSSLLVWESKVLLEANKVIKKNNLCHFEPNPNWISELLVLTPLPDGPLRARDMLLEKGIVLIVERHLPKTYLDGAALLCEDGTPVIGMTLRHDRVDNFWFVLFHEIAHIYLHLITRKHTGFVDEKVGAEDNPCDELEEEANNFARNKLISNEQWKECISPFISDERSVITDANNLGIDPAIVAGRVRYEKGDYTILSSLLGQGKIRHLFGI